MKKELLEIFNNVNSWLHFAEAKNGVLIALNGGALIGITTNLDKFCGYPNSIKFLGILFVFCLFIGLILSLWSFLPVLKIFWKEESNYNGVDPDSLSLLFFGQIQHFRHIDYLNRLYAANKISVPSTLPPLELDLAQQIIQNSGIALKKYNLFKLAISITLIGLIIPIPFLILRYLRSKFK